MTSVKQSSAISPKNKDTVELVKQNKNKDRTFKATLTSLNPHQEYDKKEKKGAISNKLNQYYRHTIHKKHNLDEEDTKHIRTTKEKEKTNDTENIIADNVAVFSEQLSFKQQHLNHHIIEAEPLVHKFNPETGNDKHSSNNVIDSNLTRTSNTGIISSFIANEKKNKINPTELINEKKTDITDIKAVMTTNDKSAVIDPLVMNKDKKIDDSFQYDDLTGVFQKIVKSELPQTITANSKNGVVFNNTPLTEKEWGSELSRIIKNNIKDINQLEIIVHPRHLGPIKILIEEAKGKNKISIIAKDAYVATLIGEHVHNIQTKLLNSGESVSSIDVINDAKLNSADQENQHQHQRHNDQLDFGVIDNNVEIKKESSKISNGIFA